jgi:hypothetical protein
MVYCDFDDIEANNQRTFHSEIRDLKGMSLCDTARLLGRIEIEKMLDEFAAFYLLFDLYKKISGSLIGSETCEGECCAE